MIRFLKQADFVLIILVSSIAVVMWWALFSITYDFIYTPKIDRFIYLVFIVFGASFLVRSSWDVIYNSIKGEKNG